jgi:hypothetical protein
VVEEAAGTLGKDGGREEERREQKRGLRGESK